MKQSQRERVDRCQTPSYEIESRKKRVSQGDDGAIHWPTLAHISDTPDGPFQRSRQFLGVPEALPHRENGARNEHTTTQRG